MSVFPTAKEVQEEIKELTDEREGLLEALNESVKKKRKAIYGAFTDKLSRLAKVLKAAEALEAVPTDTTE